MQIEERKLAIDTVSINSIRDDEEGINLNAKGINMNYVKHYNSMNKVTEEERKFVKNHADLQIKCKCIDED